MTESGGSGAVVVIAPDSFKGSAAAVCVADRIAFGWRSERPQDTLIRLPQADGGEGTLEAIEIAIPGVVRHAVGTVTGPDGRPTRGCWLELPGRVAVVELAQMAGLPLMRELDPLRATTRGVGDVISAAIDAGASEVVVGLGGSASTDGGIGALIALGARFLTAGGEEIATADRLGELARIDVSGLRPCPPITLLTDVVNPLSGPRGAAAVYGPQKGASEQTVAKLERGLAALSYHAGVDSAFPGAGAAGGAAYGFVALLGAVVKGGAAEIAELTGLRRAAVRADVVVTGEGRFDDTSMSGKVVGNVISLVRDRSMIIAGQVSAPPPVFSVSLSELAGSAERAIRYPNTYLVKAGAHAARHFELKRSGR